MKSERILLTGASGFIGKAFLNHALNKGLRVRILSRKPNEWPLQDRLEAVKGDFLTQTDWSSLLEDVQLVVHAAAEMNNPKLMSVVNTQGPEKLLKAAINAGVKRWVQLSSVGSYGPISSGLVKEEWTENPLSPYEISKTNFDKILQQASREHKIEICIVRPSNVYGPGMRNQSIQQMLKAIQKKVFTFIGPKGASANYVHVKDVVQALELCIRHPKAVNQTYIVSAWATLEEMVNGLSAGLELAPPSKRIPIILAKRLAKIMQWWPQWPLTVSRISAMSLRSRYSTEKIEKELGWKLTVSVEDGMRALSRDLGK